MAEPYDTIDPLAPACWWRFSGASGGVLNEGSKSSNNLAEFTAGAVGAFTWDYQYETAPDGVSSSMRANGSGGLYGSPTGLSSAQGTVILHARKEAGGSLGRFIAGFWDGFDVDYVDVGLDFGGSGEFVVSVQDAGTDDESWITDDGFDGEDLLPHTYAIVNPADSISDYTVYIDGVAKTVVHSAEDGVDNNHWWDDFLEEWAVGYRGGVDTGPKSGWIYYDLLAFESALTAEQILDVHRALGGGTVFSTKTIRRRNRRLFSANI